MIQFAGQELCFFEPLIRDVVDRVLVGGLVVHVEHDVVLGEGNQGAQVLGLWADAGLAYWHPHVACVFL